jgi:hypothetical protein
MNWFRRTDKREEGRGKKDETENRPSSRAPRGFDAFLFIFLAFFTGILLIKTDFLQGAPATSTQANWHVAASGATAALPVAASYNVYDSKGAGDTHSSGSCSIGGGFNAGTSTSTGTAVSDSSNVGAVSLLTAQFQEFIDGKMCPFDLGLKEIGGNLFMVGNNQYRETRGWIVQNHVASFLAQEAVSDFGKDFDGLTAGDVGKCAHKTFGKLYGHEMSTVCLLRNFEMLFFSRLEVACDGFADIGHGLGDRFALRHASGKAGTFGDIAVVFDVVNKFNLEFHKTFLLCKKDNIMSLDRQGVNGENWL